MNDKEKNAKMLDPKRFEIAKNMSVVPGGPMNNNPMNVTGVGAQPSSVSGMNQYPYADSGDRFPQMGADILNPMNVKNSGIGNRPMGQGMNAQPYGLQNQPPAAAEEQLEGMRQAQEGAKRGLMTNDFMGLTGNQAIKPGQMPGDMQGTSGPGLMAPMTSMNPMTPGADKKVIKKKGKK